MRLALLLSPLVVLAGCAHGLTGPEIHPQFEAQWEELYSCSRSTLSEGEAQQKCAEKYADVQLTGRLATVVPMQNGNTRLDVDGVMDTTVPRDGRRVLTCILVAPVDGARINALKSWHTWVTVRGPVRQVSSNRAGNTVLLAPCELLSAAEGPPAVASTSPTPALQEASRE